MKALLLTFVACIASPCLAQGRSFDSCRASDTSRALCDAEARLTDALRRNDAILLSQIYADEFTLINYRGRKVDKAAVLNAIRTGALRFDSLTTSELQMRVYERVGVVIGQQHQVAREPGGDEVAHPKDVIFTHLYVLRAGQWLLMASQITPIAR